MLQRGMTTNSSDALTRLSDQELLAEVRTLAHREPAETAGLIASLVELDARVWMISGWLSGSNSGAETQSLTLNGVAEV